MRAQKDENILNASVHAKSVYLFVFFVTDAVITEMTSETSGAHAHVELWRNLDKSKVFDHVIQKHRRALVLKTEIVDA